MSMQGSVIVVADNPAADLTAALGTAGAFPVIETSLAEARDAIAAAKPAAIVIAEQNAAVDEGLAEYLARKITPAAPIVPVIACVIDGASPAYREALPVPAELHPALIAARLASALRVRTLHAAVLRRATISELDGYSVPGAAANDPLLDATVVVAGRGRSYPQLATAIGEHAGLIGALSVETAARYLKARTIDGLVIGDGFSPRHVHAFLTVLAEDARFRDLPIAVLGRAQTNFDNPFPELPHLTVIGDAAELPGRILPYIRLHAFETRLKRIMASLDADGTLDPRTGLLRFDAFTRTLDRALGECTERGTSLSLARMTFPHDLEKRAAIDAARLIGTLIRGADFAGREDDGAVLIAFTETDLRHAHVVARRIATAVKYTMLTPNAERPDLIPSVTLATRKSTDNVATLLARLVTPAVAAE